MIILHQQDLYKNGKFIATLRIYLEGTGDPKNDHNIKAFSIDGNGMGYIPSLNEVTKIENLGNMNL